MAKEYSDNLCRKRIDYIDMATLVRLQYPNFDDNTGVSI